MGTSIDPNILHIMCLQCFHGLSVTINLLVSLLGLVSYGFGNYLFLWHKMLCKSITRQM